MKKECFAFLKFFLKTFAAQKKRTFEIKKKTQATMFIRGEVGRDPGSPRSVNSSYLSRLALAAVLPGPPLQADSRKTNQQCRATTASALMFTRWCFYVPLPDQALKWVSSVACFVQGLDRLDASLSFSVRFQLTSPVSAWTKFGLLPKPCLQVCSPFCFPPKSKTWSFMLTRCDWAQLSVIVSLIILGRWHWWSWHAVCLSLNFLLLYCFYNGQCKILLPSSLMTETLCWI